MKLQTQIPLQRQPEAQQISYASKVLLLGSCFSENIGRKFEFYQFQHTVNPFGILFHPKAIETFLERVVLLKKYNTEDFIFHNEQFHCFDAHSTVSDTNKTALQEKLNTILAKTQQQISKATHVIITLGTAWVYHHIQKNTTVANCHKIPQKEFEKRILSVAEITKSLQHIHTLLERINPNIKIIYTVSPVRHLKDGFVENMWSKAHLISAIHQIKNKQSLYFPSYEIMMDELRDYRFYAPDMIHPNETAIQYIWERFQHVWLHANTKNTMKEVTTIQNGLAHRPFNLNSKQHQQFLAALQLKKENLIKKFPFMKL